MLFDWNLSTCILATQYGTFVGVSWSRLRARLHRAPESILHKRDDDASYAVLIDHNGVTPKWVATPFSSDSIVANENCVAIVIAALTQIDSNVWCKQVLIDSIPGSVFCA